MVRRRPSRILATFLALWLSFIGLESTVLLCPMHEMRHAAAEDATLDVMIGMAMPGDDAGDIPVPEHSSHRCSCPGSCSISPIGTLPRFELSLGGLVGTPQAPPFIPQAVARPATDRLLPPATAPPHSALI